MNPPDPKFPPTSLAAKRPGTAVDHPPHYNASPAGVECIDVVEHMSFNIGNAVKYLWRADHKGAPVQDLEKAAWYIQREIARRKKESSGG